MVRSLAAGVLLFGVLGVWSAQQPPPPNAPGAKASPAQQPDGPAALQRPVFRGGTHFVRVDAYPVENGTIVEGLSPEDFEVLEDGKPQTIDSFDFIRFDTFTPEATRRDPSTQREGFEMAADLRYRLFVIFADLALSTSAGPFAANNDLIQVQRPLVNFLDRVLGPQDLYGFMTSRNSVKDLVLARKSTVTSSQIVDMWRSSFIDKDEADQMFGCGCGQVTDQKLCAAIIDSLKLRHRADATYAALHDLVAQLGSLRQERKNIVLVTNLLPRWGANSKLLELRGGTIPPVGISRGRLGTVDRTRPGAGDETYCSAEFQRLSMMDFEPKYRELLQDARKENVTFYVVTPGGLQAPATVQGMDDLRRATDDLVSLAHETDGIAVVNTNDLNGGLKKIADDLAAYYVLGYYTTNTTFDGGLRNIKVRLKGTGKTVRARRQYRAPTQAEIAALAAGSTRASSTPAGGAAVPNPAEAALTLLERASRPFASYAAAAGPQLTVVTELSPRSIETARWKDGAEVEIVASGPDGAEIARAHGQIAPGASAATIPLTPGAVWPSRISVRLKSGTEPAVDDWFLLPAPSGTLTGDALTYRASARAARRPVATFAFARNERVRIEWPVLTPLDRREVRLLDRRGKPLPVELPVSEDPATHAVVMEMALSGLGNGDYLVELTAGSGAVVEHRLLAIRVR